MNVVDVTWRLHTKCASERESSIVNALDMLSFAMDMLSFAMDMLSLLDMSLLVEFAGYVEF